MFTGFVLECGISIQWKENISLLNVSGRKSQCRDAFARYKKISIFYSFYFSHNRASVTFSVVQLQKGFLYLSVKFTSSLLKISSSSGSAYILSCFSIIKSWICGSSWGTYTVPSRYRAYNNENKSEMIKGKINIITLFQGHSSSAAKRVLRLFSKSLCTSSKLFK